jgi:hypothetical protein
MSAKMLQCILRILLFQLDLSPFSYSSPLRCSDYADRWTAAQLGQTLLGFKKTTSQENRSKVRTSTAPEHAMTAPAYGQFCSHEIAAALAKMWIKHRTLDECKQWAREHHVNEPHTIDEAAKIRQEHIESYGLLSALED